LLLASAYVATREWDLRFLCPDGGLSLVGSSCGVGVQLDFSQNHAGVQRC
jgi:hypothetical protein